MTGPPRRRGWTFALCSLQSGTSCHGPSLAPSPSQTWRLVRISRHASHLASEPMQSKLLSSTPLRARANCSFTAPDSETRNARYRVRVYPELPYEHLRCAMRRALHKFDIKSNTPFHSCRLPRVDVFSSLLTFTEPKSSRTHTPWIALSLRLPTTPRVVICEKC